MASKPATFRPKGRPSAIQLRRGYDAKRRAEQPWRNLYKTARWAAIRESVLLDEPLCRRCIAEGVYEAATVVNHVERHGGDALAFYAGPFEPLCKPHHDREVQREEREAARREVGRGLGPV
jgi:5-methylcytosine-specific restriction protein A